MGIQMLPVHFYVCECIILYFPCSISKDVDVIVSPCPYLRLVSREVLMIEREFHQDWIMHAKLNSITFITTMGNTLAPLVFIIIVVMNYRNNPKIFPCNGLAV